MQFPHIGSDTGVVFQFLGWIASVASIYMYSSPIPTVQRVLRTRSTGQFSDTTYVFTLLNCLLWVAYAQLQGGRLQPLICNALGAALEISYLAVFLRFHTKRDRVLLIGKMLLLLVSCVALIVFVQHSEDRDYAAKVTGMCALGVCIVMFGAPLSVMCMVLRTSSVEFMPLGLTLGSFASSGMWSAYSWWVGDAFIGVPNNVGYVLSIAQLVLWVSVRFGCRPLPPRSLPLVSNEVAQKAVGEEEPSVCTATV
jgi:solute carrier family 50 protein (sugar transporter)